MKIKITLSQGSIQDAREQLQNLDFKEKLRQFVEELADYGISVAEQNTGVWGKYIRFEKEVDETKTGCRALVLMYDTQLIIPPHDSRPVSPSMMAEWGSGSKGLPTQTTYSGRSVGQGTFPEQTHAFDPKGWWYKGKDDKWHHSYGMEAYRPMYKAYTEINNHIKEVAKRVFSG